MSGLENGMLVQHASLGLGKIVALEEKAVHVFFATSDARFATKLRLPMSLPFLTPSASTNGWLSGLTDFALDETTGRYGLDAKWLSHGDAVARFVNVYPKGFEDPKYAGDAVDKRERVARWRRAHDSYEETLGNGEGERLLAKDDVAGLVERAVKVEKQIRPLHGEKTAFEDALADVDDARGYFAALFELLAQERPEQSRFEAFAKAVAAMAPGVSLEAGWSIATLLPFLARPDCHMLLRPKFTSEVAQRLGLELAYAPRPNWRTYAALLESCETLLGKLRSLGARDLIDVESFMSVVTAKQPRVKPLPVAKARARLAT